MRRVSFTLALALLLALTLAACAPKEPYDPTYQSTVGGRVFTVDPVNKTITADGQVHRFEVSGGGSSTSYTITYPDGEAYYWRWSGNIGSGGWTDGYSEDTHIPGRDLIDALARESAAGGGGGGGGGGNPLLGLLLIAIGAFGAIAPRTAWYIGYGWRFKDAEPSDAALGWERFGGIATAVIGIFLLF